MQPRAGDAERIALQPALHLVLGPVGAGVRLGVAVEAVGQALEQASALRRRARDPLPRDAASCTANTSLPSTTLGGDARMRAARAAMLPPAVTAPIGVNSP